MRPSSLRILGGLLSLLTPLCPALPAQSSPRPFDIILTGGTVHDGTGAPGYRADVGIRGRRIAGLGDLSGQSATTRIDVSGHCVAPGFIDTHAHADAVVLRRPQATNFLAMGVTTIISGNCGTSMLRIGNHFDQLTRRRASLNYASLIGHATVRRAVLGTENRAPTAAELQAMRDHVDRAMQAGAMGMSTGLIYVPGTFATTDELIALAKVVSRYGGVYASHMRNENDRVLEAIDEALRIGREAGVAVHLSHLKASAKQNWGRGKQILARMQDARNRGQRVTGDQYAYPASSTGLDVLFPTKALSIGREEFARRLVKDSAFRKEVHDHLMRKMSGVGFGDLSWCRVARAQGNAAANGKTIKEVAKLFYGKDGREEQADAAIKLFADTKGASRVNMVYFSMSEDDVQTIMRAPFVGIACDAGIPNPKGQDKPHPRGSGNNPRVLARYVRERKTIPLELAVHKMTQLPAQIFELRDRGTIRVGSFADVTVFDPKTVADRATYDQPRLPPTGIPFVLVNGTVVIRDGKHTGARPGQVLRRAVTPSAEASPSPARAGKR